ncbi:MAG TPA: FKBP-type peptidyl-prolyl cis-trans isomerase [Gallionella sp.]|nr:FKBP-type peptidyl-prolyl cis-trans isomerase [Gallionella sp.]
MMKRTLFFPLALLFAAGFFSTAAYAEQPAVKKEAGNITQLIKTDRKLGKGEKATSGRDVAVHYTGWLYDAAAPGHKGKKFDSSHDRGKPIEFKLGAGMVIDGWEAGIEGMKVGGQRTLIIPPFLGYGAEGAPGAIPPNATLIFDVELLGVR